VTVQTEDRSISQLVSDSVAHASRLLQDELALAKAELAEKVGLTGSAVKYLGAGAVLMTPAIVLLLLALSAELMALGLSPPLAYLVSGVGAALLAGLMIWIGQARLSPRTLAPRATIGEMRRDKALLAELTR
jgi:Putative Actinobacterial Holin-X, holin superfamily III